MIKQRFLEVEVTNGAKFTVNVDYVVALQEKQDSAVNGSVLFIAHGKSDGTRLQLSLSAPETQSVKEWLQSH